MSLHRVVVVRKFASLIVAPSEGCDGVRSTLPGIATLSAAHADMNLS
jgi:hypothetical protein